MKKLLPIIIMALAAAGCSGNAYEVLSAQTPEEIKEACENRTAVGSTLNRADIIADTAEAVWTPLRLPAYLAGLPVGAIEGGWTAGRNLTDYALDNPTTAKVNAVCTNLRE